MRPAGHRRTGSADLPLHHGRVPEWLSARMSRLGAVMSEAIVQHFGRDELLRRLADPFWFQSLGAVMGMDWHSSGITTSVLAALKRGLAPRQRELGIHVCGGRGRHARNTPRELIAIGERAGFDGAALADRSRLVAKIDNAAVQDGFDLYLHGFIVTDDGRWAVVQQGMHGERRQARRYHWLSEGLESFVDAPHTAIEGANLGHIVNLTDRAAGPSRVRQVQLLEALGPDGIVGHYARLVAAGASPRRPARPRPAQPAQLTLPHLVMPHHHDVRAGDVDAQRLRGALAAAASRGPKDFADLLLTPGVGPRTIRALAMVAEVIYGAPYRFTDPARFAFAHGGKDGHPFPVPLRVYEATIRVLKSAVQKAKLGREEEMAALKRLDEEARLLEREASFAQVAEAIATERRCSHAYGGRSIWGWEAAPEDLQSRGSGQGGAPPPAQARCFEDPFTPQRR